MTYIEKQIIENKAIEKFIETLLEQDSWEFENGFWRAVLEGRLQGTKSIIKIFENKE